MHRQNECVTNKRKISMNTKNYNCKFYSGNEALNKYLSDIRKYKVLTPDEEVKLFERIANGDEKAKSKIVESNQRFVYSLAKIYSKDEKEVLDYVNEGNIGLITAIDTFDVTKGMKFITYAVWYIRRSMNYYLSTINNLVVKSNNMKYWKKIEYIKQEYICKNGFEPTNEEIIDIMKEKYSIDIKDVCDVYDLNISSINQQLDDDYTVEDNSEFNDATSSVNGYETETENTYNNELVGNILSTLTDKQKDIIKMSFGIGYDRPFTAEEIGIKYEMDEVTVNQLKNNIIAYLKQNKSEYKLAI